MLCILEFSCFSIFVLNLEEVKTGLIECNLKLHKTFTWVYLWLYNAKIPWLNKRLVKLLMSIYWRHYEIILKTRFGS